VTSPVGEGALRERIAGFLRVHHVASVATVGQPGSPDDGMPHAASVFYSVDDRLRVAFLSKRSSRHGRDIVAGSPVAMTVAGDSEDWREIQGIQLWGSASILHGPARAGALTTYTRQFPFVRALFTDPQVAARLTQIEVFRVTPTRAAMTDNRRGLFGQEVLDDLGEVTVCRTGSGPS
jgi:uncharacterized protein YhbP (UPF0306 family)